MGTRVTRLNGWQAALREVIEAHLRQPFKYGKHDGPIFSGDAVKAMTGIDPIKGMRGYRTLTGGMKKLRSRGFSDPIDPFATLMERHTAVLFARPGDVVQFGKTCVGICAGAGRVYAFSEDRGLGLQSIDAASAAYKV